VIDSPALQDLQQTIKEYAISAKGLSKLGVQNVQVQDGKSSLVGALKDAANKEDFINQVIGAVINEVLEPQASSTQQKFLDNLGEALEIGPTREATSTVSAASAVVSARRASISKKPLAVAISKETKEAGAAKGKTAGFTNAKLFEFTGSIFVKGVDAKSADEDERLLRENPAFHQIVASTLVGGLLSEHQEILNLQKHVKFTLS